jgi:hypothetical protein
MSSHLANTADLANSSAFRDTVVAAMVEHAVASLPAKCVTPSDYLAARVIYDAASVATPFVRLVANDPAVSEAGRDYTEDDVRRVVIERWEMVAATVPNLGG